MTGDERVSGGALYIQLFGDGERVTLDKVAAHGDVGAHQRAKHTFGLQDIA